MTTTGNDGQIAWGIAAKIAQEGVTAFVPCHTLQIFIAPILFRAVLGQLVGFVQNGIVQRLQRLYRHAVCKLHNGGKVCRTHTGGTGGKANDHILGYDMSLVFIQMHPDKLFPLTLVWQVNQNLSVKPSCKSSVDDTHTALAFLHIEVGSGKNKHGALGVYRKTVHLRKQGIECHFLTVGGVGAAALSANGVDFIYEQNGRGISPCLFEQGTDSFRATALIFGDKGAGNGGNKGHIAFSSHGLGKHGLAGTGRTVEQHALGRLQALCGKLLGISQIVNEEFKLVLGICRADHIRKVNVWLFHIVQYAARIVCGSGAFE